MPESATRPAPWLPDWRNGAGYPDPEAPMATTSRHRWRWEFQRRDPVYQRDWAERTDRPTDFWRRRYGLRAPLDPRYPTAFFVTDRRWLIVPPKKGDQKCEVTIRQGTALVEFDLTRPLRPQFKWAEFHLQAWVIDESDLRKSQIESGFSVKRTRRGEGFQWRPKDWLRYLRLLDADASGASKDEIVGILYPKLTNKYPERTQDGHLTDDRQAARKLLRDRKYILL
jgi:hypothetical protein